MEDMGDFKIAKKISTKKVAKKEVKVEKPKKIVKQNQYSYKNFNIDSPENFDYSNLESVVILFRIGVDIVVLDLAVISQRALGDPDLSAPFIT